MLRYIAWGWLGLCALAGLVLAYGLVALPHTRGTLGGLSVASASLTALASPAARYLKRIGPKRKEVA
jgi:hypothetical protein